MVTKLLYKFLRFIICNEMYICGTSYACVLVYIGVLFIDIEKLILIVTVARN